MKKYNKPFITIVSLTDPLLFGINNTVGDGTQLGKEQMFEEEEEATNLNASKSVWDE